MTTKINNQTDKNLLKKQYRNVFSIPEIIDLRSIQATIFALNSYEPEPLYINGKYLYV